MALVNYSSSDASSDEDNEEENKQSKEITRHLPQKECLSKPKQSLPLPDDIKDLFQDGTDSKKRVEANPLSHSGRIRSFPHEEGNWATLVYAKYDIDADFQHMQQELFLCLRPHEFQPMDDYHISFSRTVVIRYHWIQDICDTLMKALASKEGCGCEIDGIEVLTNDEKTRSFLTLSVSSGDDLLDQYVSVVDTCFEQYKLQKYYTPPSFHVSIGWCLGDVTESVSKKTSQKMQDILKRTLNESTDLKYFYINKLHMKTGNKQFMFELESSIT